MVEGLRLEPIFDRAEYDRRRRAVRTAMAARGIDVLLCTTPENVFYLTGYQTFAYSTYQLLVLPLESEPFLVIRYLESFLADRYSVVRDIVRWDDTDDPIAATIAALQARRLAGLRVGYEERTSIQPVSTWSRLKSGLDRLVDGSGLVEQARAVKSPPELACMRQAAHYTDLGMAAGIAAAQTGATENDIAAAAFDAMTRAGSEYMAKDPIITSGDRAGIPHTTYRRRVLQSGDTVLLELSGVHNRYFAPLMRSGWLGTPDRRVADWPAVCLEALAAGIEAARPGATAGEVDAACRGVIERRQLWQHYRKRAGYSVGIGFMSWIEGAIATLWDGDRTVLAPGMCFHIPVAMRIYGVATVGISETVVVTEASAEVLGRAPQDFFAR